MECMFIGKDGSMGLKKGNIYNIETSISGKFLWAYWYEYGCPYSSLEKFLENWKVVRSDGVLWWSANRCNNRNAFNVVFL